MRMLCSFLNLLYLKNANHKVDRVDENTFIFRQDREKSFKKEQKVKIEGREEKIKEVHQQTTL